MKTTQTAIIRTLLYFDIFHHPLHRKELYELLPVKATREAVDQELNNLIEMNFVGTGSDYFYIADGGSTIDDRLIKLNRANKYHRIARIVSHIISHHPFVRGVFISGSLSKSAISQRDDIDYFVIAEPGRIWVCRAFLMLFKKIFLFNSKKYFCINYFIDTENLEIPDQNIFTATELAFLKPQINSELFTAFLETNQWVKTYFPNKVFSSNGCVDKNNPFLKRMLEKLLNGRRGEKMDNLFLSLYRRRSFNKYGNMEKEAFNINFKSNKDVAKHHPRGFQNIITGQFDSKILSFEKKYNVDLTL